MPDLAWNLKVWDGAYAWPKDGDEWDDFARASGVPYETWKDELRRAFIVPFVRPETTALEIGPGHGRWSVLLQPKVAALHLVDLSSSCIEFCRKRLAAAPNVSYHVNDGKILSAIATGSVDFVWSFDTFVHIEEPELRAYAAELHRVMKPQSMGVIHHPGHPTPEQRRGGCRSDVNALLFLDILARNRLHMIKQVSKWGKGCSLELTGDMITVFARP